MAEVTVSEAAAAVRNSPQGLYVALGFAYRSADEFATWLESGPGLLAPGLVPKVMERLSAAEARAQARAESAEYEDFGRRVVEALQHYAKINGPIRLKVRD